MTAAVRAAEAASHFTERDVWRWRHYMGRLCEPGAAVELYGLVHDEGGCHLRDRTLGVGVCIYVAVDDAGACLYIGQCRRPGGSVVQRIDGHHAIPDHATGLWVLPIRADCPKAALDSLEGEMISAYRPPYNVMHCPATVRAVRAEL